MLSAHKPAFYQKTTTWRRRVLQNQGYLNLKKCLGSFISDLLFKPKRWLKEKTQFNTLPAARKQTAETLCVYYTCSVSPLHYWHVLAPNCSSCHPMSGTPLSAACLSPLLCSAFPVPGTNAMRCYNYEEQEGSVVWARLSAVAPWFCWRRSADSLGSSCCVGQKQGPIPQQYFCLLPSYLQQRQQAWFSASVLPFLPLSCGRSSLSLAPCPPANNFQLLELLRAWRWLCPNSLWQKVGEILMLGIRSHMLSSGSAQQRYGPVYLLSS